MASASLSSSALTLCKQFTPSNSSSHTFPTFFNSKNHIGISQTRRSPNPWGMTLTVKSAFDLTFFERDLQDSDAPPQSSIPGQGFPDVEDKEEPQTPPGLRKYESMVVLRPDMSEDERLAFTQKYEELLVAGGGMYVEVFNRGVIPLAYAIRKKNKAGESNTYLDGIYLLFTYFTKPDSLSIVGEVLLADDNVIRSSAFKIRKRKIY
ncbi:small ribosomal subunit protein bS6c-like [Primulina huaijiensis]|uniref:small ribosomal subunit protein bS6c-like n=1 Tax=Primulina huaijiensis TaxID=1492673 RepID=UPI003CC6F3C4